MEMNYNLLDPSYKILQKMENFNAKYDTDIKITNAGKFKPGTYDKIKKAATQHMFPKFNNARKLSTVLNNDEWKFSRFRSEIVHINNSLSKFRKSHSEIYSNVNGKKIYDKWHNILKSQSFNGSWEISDTPHYDMIKDTFGYTTFCIGTYPYFEDGATKFVHSKEYTKKKRDQALERLKLDTISPKNIYLNVEFPLNDINIEMTYRNEWRTTIPFGNGRVYFSINLYALFTSFNLRNFDAKMVFFHDNPKHFSHPYAINAIPSSDETDGLRNYGQYGLGNLCLGDFQEQFIIEMVTGRIGDAHHTLKKWVSYFPWATVTPLNRISYSVVGIPNDWHDTIIAHTEPIRRICKAEHTILGDKMIETHCNSCAKKVRCELVNTFRPVEIPPDSIKVLTTWLKDTNRKTSLLNTLILLYSKLKMSLFKSAEVTLEVESIGYGLNSKKWSEMTEKTIDPKDEKALVLFAIEWIEYAEEIWLVNQLKNLIGENNFKKRQSQFSTRDLVFKRLQALLTARGSTPLTNNSFLERLSKNG